MAMWKESNYKSKTVQVSFSGGENTFLPSYKIDDSESSESRNFSSENYPSLSVRQDRLNNLAFGGGAIATISSPNTITKSGVNFHYVDNGIWKYSNNSDVIQTIVDPSASGTGTKLLPYTDASGSSKTAFLSVTKLYYGITTATQVTDFAVYPTYDIAYHKRRFFVVSYNKISYSALNDITNWTGTGSGSISTTSKSDTACVSYNNKLNVFGKFSMQELYGTGPDDFQLIDISNKIGCMSNKSYAELDGVLYFMSGDGFIYQYNGAGLPVKISEAVEYYLKNASYLYDVNTSHLVSMGTYNKKIYVSFAYGSSETDNNLTLVYDTYFKKWNVEDIGIRAFCNADTKLVGLTVGGLTIDMSSNTATGKDYGTTDISAYFISKNFMHDTLSRKKTLSDLWVLFDASPSGSLKISISTNIVPAFTQVYDSGTLTGSYYNQRVLIPVSQIQNVEWYRFKFETTGHVVIHYLEKNIGIKQR